MENKSRIRFNPTTKEVEIEGSEEFVKLYFAKLQEMISASSEDAPERETGRSSKQRRRRQGALQAAAPKKAGKTPEKESGEKRVTNISAIVTLVQGSEKGISTAELKEKTGLTERQIWSIVDRAAKEGKIRKLKRGMYASIPSGQR